MTYTEVGEPHKLGVQSVRTLDEFETLLGAYAKQNPEKYALKLANGDFEKQRNKLKGIVPPVAPVTPVVENVKVEEKKNHKEK